MTFLRKTAIGALAALTIAAGVTAASAPAEARWHGRGGWGGPGVAAGVIGGLAVGALAAQAYRPHYPAYGYGYSYAPVYGHGYGHGCFNQRRPAHDRWGNFIGYRVVRVCR